jgi:RNA polymerase sigma-70 factor (ECF subfamily)
LRIFRHAANYAETAKFTTFLYTIARNLWIDHVRAHAVEPRAASLDASPSDGESTLSDCLPASARSRPDRQVELAELDAQLRAALDALPEDHRLVVVFSEVCGMRYQEIAALMKIPVGTVKSRMHTAVFQLRQLLSKKGRMKKE